MEVPARDTTAARRLALESLNRVAFADPEFDLPEPDLFWPTFWGWVDRHPCHVTIYRDADGHYRALLVGNPGAQSGAGKGLTAVEATARALLGALNSSRATGKPPLGR